MLGLAKNIFYPTTPGLKAGHQGVLHFINFSMVEWVTFTFIRT